MSETIDRPDVSDAASVDVASKWLAAFEAALTIGDVDAVAALFAETSYWRDLVAFTWNIKTVEGPAGVRDMLTAQLRDIQPRLFRFSEPPSEAAGVIEGWFTFETHSGRGEGVVRLQDGKAWTLLTALVELKGFEELQGVRRPKGAVHGEFVGRKSWLERREQEIATLGYETQPYVLVIGGGQGGIALGARLRHLGVPALVIDKGGRAGDAWRNRYKSLCLHDPVWYDHLPYMSFPDNWPIFAPKDKIADWLEMYVNVMEVNYWTKATATHASFDEQAGVWTVVVERGGREVTLKPTHLVFATGVSGKPNIPVFKGMERFEGEQHHSSKHPGPDAYNGKRVVVIGSNNSAHDICAALAENDVDVTMVQRSSTHIVRSDIMMEVCLGALYSESAVAEGMTTRRADMTFASIPYRVLPDVQRPLYAEIARREETFYRDLANAGFQHDWGDDASGLFVKYLRRGSGYYIDVGASQMIIDRRIKLKAGQVEEITASAVVLADGTELEADVIVYATGYGSMNNWVADLVSREMADKVGKCWGLGSGTLKDPGPWEGELRNMWKPTQQPNLWFHGGNLHQSRDYSLYLALQLKARFEDVATPVYGLQDVHHRG